MTIRQSLEQELGAWVAGDPDRRDLAATVLALAKACARLSSLLAQGELAGGMSKPTGRKGPTDEQKVLDVIASDWIVEALKAAPAAALLTEEVGDPVIMNPDAPLLVAVDPIDGSSNIEANASIGTIFSILPRTPDKGVSAHSFLQPGRNQLAAGFVVYGPQTTLAFSYGAGTRLYTLNRETGHFIMTDARPAIPPRAKEFAINVSNYRHWDEPMKVWIDECLEGTSGVREQDYNMRWTASPVAEFYRILVRGGVFLYPGDARRGYTHGRLRLIYEANPFAFVVEDAGGAATDGKVRILDLVPESPHQHVPFVAGARDEVAHVAYLNDSPLAGGTRSPLFTRRGLIRA